MTKVIGSYVAYLPTKQIKHLPTHPSETEDDNTDTYWEHVYDEPFSENSHQVDISLSLNSQDSNPVLRSQGGLRPR
jgi:DNA polymerase III psi subunit